MPIELTRVNYSDLNARQKENYNFQKISAVLADFGFTTLRLTDDWQGADFLAQHIDGKTFLKIQLKGRLSFAKKYQGKNLYVAFEQRGVWYLYPHDDVLKLVLGQSNIESTDSWEKNGAYSFPGISPQMAGILEPYKIEGPDLQVRDAAAAQSAH